MSRVLVVDDSKIDRMLVARLLRQDDSLTIEFAEHGGEALEKMGAMSIDAVITDLMMPQMNGLELVTEIRMRHASVPVVLMTSAGNEDVASEALKLGAASYVPKRLLASDLLETLHNVLSAAGKQLRERHLFGCLMATNYTLVLENDRTLIPPLVTLIQEAMQHLGLGDDAERMRVGVALEEALVNALYHGNLAVDGGLREEDYEAYHAMAERRRHEAPYCNRKIHVEVSMDRSQAKITIRDEGTGFDPSRLPDPTDPANLERVSGRGVFLMRTFMDSVQYNANGTEVTLVKRRTSPILATTGAHDSN